MIPNDKPLFDVLYTRLPIITVGYRTLPPIGALIAVGGLSSKWHYTIGGGGRGRRRGGTYRSRRSRSPQWRRHTPRTKDGSTVRHAFCKTFSARYPFLLTLSRADCCRKRLRWTATTPACRRRWTSDVGQSEWLDVGPGRTVSRRITDTGTNGRTRGECLLAADGATGLNRGSGSRIRYIGARSPSSTGRGLRTRRTTRAVPVYGRKQKNDQFQFAGRIEEETR